MKTSNSKVPWAVLRNPEFLKLWIGQIISYLGDRITQMALLGWLIASAKQTGPEMAHITFFNILPSFIFGQMAGAFSDRFPRKWIMVISDLLRAGVVFSLAFIITGQKIFAPMVYFLVFLVGVCTAFFYPAKLSIIPNLVDSEELQSANALTSGSGMIATLIGTYIAGTLIEKYGFSTGFLVNGITFVISALAILWIRPKSSTSQAEVLKHQSSSIILDFKQAWEYLRNHRRAWQLILLSTALSFFSSFFYISLTVLAVDYFHLGTEGVGKLLTMLGCGMIAGSIMAIFLGKWFKTTYFLAGAFLVIFLTNATAGIVHSYSMAWVWLTLLGAANAIVLVTMDTLLQKATPDRFRGKVFGFRSMLSNGVFLISLLGVSEILKLASPLMVFKGLSLMSIMIFFVILLIEQDIAYLFVRAIFRSVMKLFFSLEVEGEEHLKYKTKVILAGNHTGFLDIPILVSSFNRPIKFLTAIGVFNWPVVGWIVKRVGVIPVEKGKGDRAIAKAVEHLKTGKVVGIFPEGELTRDGKLGPFRRGVARLQTDSAAPIVPFVIHGGYEAWHWGQKLPKLRKVTLQFGQPILSAHKDEKELVKEMQQKIEFMKEALERRERAKKEKVYQDSVLSLMQSKSDVYGARVALSLKEGHHWKELTYIELSRRARGLASYLIEHGLKRGDRIAILSESRPEWSIALFGAIRSGAITVPLDIKLTSVELVSILSNAEPRILFISSQFIETAKALKTLLPCIEEVILLEDDKGVSGFSSIFQFKTENLLEGVNREIDETALIIYTSGTTGNPKGVMISFQNLIFQVKNFEELMQLGPKDMFLSILPLNHLLELTGGFLGVLHAGGRICYSQSLHPQEISKIMREKKVTYMVAVPLFLKMLKGSIEKEIRRSDTMSQKLFQFLFYFAGIIPSRVVRKIIFYSIHQQFGGKLRGFISGGAPLEMEAAGYFNRLGLPIYQGYGLTETSPVIAVNTPQHNRLGSVGRSLVGVSVQISNDGTKEEGEILTKGPHIMQGYYKREDLTREVFDEAGWFHTGDVGKIDEDGFLYITGRIKNLIVLPGGKKVHPEEVEACLSRSSLFKEVCVLGRRLKEGRKEGAEEVAVIVVPSDSLKQKCREPQQLQKEVEKEVDVLAQDLAHYKKPSNVFIHAEDLPKTATRKIKRPLVLEWLNAQDEMPLGKAK